MRIVERKTVGWRPLRSLSVDQHNDDRDYEREMDALLDRLRAVPARTVSEEAIRAQFIGGLEKHFTDLRVMLKAGPEGTARVEERLRVVEIKVVEIESRRDRKPSPKTILKRLWTARMSAPAFAIVFVLSLLFFLFARLYHG